MSKIEINKHTVAYLEGTFTAFQAEHTPYNKHRWEVHNSSILLCVRDYNGRKPGANPEAWTEIHLQEVTQVTQGGRTQVRDLTITLDPEARAALWKYLDESEAEDYATV